MRLITLLLTLTTVFIGTSAMALSTVNPGGACNRDSDCYGGANCCSGICKLGSCRMDGSCDADNDCYGWCHNIPGKCNLIGSQNGQGTCRCPTKPPKPPKPPKPSTAV